MDCSGAGRMDQAISSGRIGSCAASGAGVGKLKQSMKKFQERLQKNFRTIKTTKSSGKNILAKKDVFSFSIFPFFQDFGKILYVTDVGICADSNEDFCRWF